MAPSKPEITVHDNDVPSFVAAELDRLYGGRYASLTHFRIYDKLAHASTYVCRVDGVVTALLLFKIEQNKLRVLNESINLSALDIERFTSFMFHRYRILRLIAFHAIDTDRQHLPQPSTAIFYGNDMWMTAPDSPEAYLKNLDAKTRQNIGRCTRNIKRAFPSFTYQVLEKEAASEAAIRSILGFSRSRLHAKGEVSGDDEAEIARIIQTTRECGLVGIATIDGRICGGQIIYRFGDNFAYRVTGHDPLYDPYSLGFLGCYLGACACIERKARILYMGWGTLDYKFRLGGKQRELHDVIVFRSHTSVALHSRLLWNSSRDGFIRRARQAVHAAARMREPAPSIARMLIASVRLLRQIRQSVAR